MRFIAGCTAILIFATGVAQIPARAETLKEQAQTVFMGWFTCAVDQDRSFAPMINDRQQLISMAMLSCYEHEQALQTVLERVASPGKRVEVPAMVEKTRMEIIQYLNK